MRRRSFAGKFDVSFNSLSTHKLLFFDFVFLVHCRFVFTRNQQSFLSSLFLKVEVFPLLKLQSFISIQEIAPIGVVIVVPTTVLLTLSSSIIACI